MMLTTMPLVGGPDRPPSKEMIMQSRANERQRLADSRAAPAAGPTGYSSYMSSANLTGAGGGGGQQETYWSSISKAVSERTAKLGTVQDSMDQLAESSSNLANEAHKFVQTQKRNAVMGGEFSLSYFFYVFGWIHFFHFSFVLFVFIFLGGLCDFATDLLF